MAYDATRRLTVLFGGWDGTVAHNDTWEWNGTAWSQRTSPAPPSGRSAVAMAYDAARKVTVLFGGETPAGRFGDTWTWNGTSWAEAPVDGPEARSFAGAAWDSDAEVVLLFGGWNGYTTLDDLWAWNGSSWSARAPDGGPPGARANFGMVYDPVHGGGTTVVFGGSTDNAGNGLYDDTWVLQAGAWELPSVTTAPSARAGFGFAYDTARSAGILYGGFEDSGTYLADTWTWTGDWSPLSTTSAPPGRWRGNMVYDSARGVMVFFGGAAPPSTYFAETWELSW